MKLQSQTTEQIALNLLQVAPVQLEQAIENLSPEHAQSVERALLDIAEKAALFSGYVQERKGTHGCGIRTVPQSVNYAFERRNKVRKALGFKIHDDFRSVMIDGILSRRRGQEDQE